MTRLETKIKLLKSRKKRLEDMKKEINEDIKNIKFDRSITIAPNIEISDSNMIKITIDLPHRPNSYIRYSEIKVIADALGLDDFKICEDNVGFVIVC